MKEKALAGVLILAIPYISHANDITYGYTPTINTFTIEDPDGNTTPSISTSIFHITAKIDARRGNAWLGEIGYQASEFTAEGNSIGQDATRWIFGVGYQKRIPVKRGLDIHAIGILGVSQAEFASRHQVDDDGYLVNKFEKRTSSDPFLKAGLSYTFTPSRDWSLEIFPHYEYSLGENFSGYGLTFGFYQ